MNSKLAGGQYLGPDVSENLWREASFWGLCIEECVAGAVFGGQNFQAKKINIG